MPNGTIVIVFLAMLSSSCAFNPNLSFEAKIPEVPTAINEESKNPMTLTTERVVTHGDKKYLTVALPDSIQKEPSVVYNDGRWIVIVSVD